MCEKSRYRQLTISCDEHATNYRTAASSKPVVKSLKNTLRARTQLWRCIMSDVTAACRPYCRMRDTLNEFEG